MWKSYTWNCKEHVTYSLCGKVIPGACKEHVIYSLCGKAIPGTCNKLPLKKAARPQRSQINLGLFVYIYIWEWMWSSGLGR